MEMWFALFLVICVAGNNGVPPFFGKSVAAVNSSMDQLYAWFNQNYVVYILGIIAILFVIIITICIVYKCKKSKRNTNKGYDGVQSEWEEGSDDYITDIEMEKQLI